jgi:hypothetical protein
MESVTPLLLYKSIMYVILPGGMPVLETSQNGLADPSAVMADSQGRLECGVWSRSFFGNVLTGDFADESTILPFVATFPSQVLKHLL